MTADRRVTGKSWTSTREPLDLADDEAFPRSLYNRLGQGFQRVDFEPASSVTRIRRAGRNTLLVPIRSITSS